jgi:hypothetical protein
VSLFGSGGRLVRANWEVEGVEGLGGKRRMRKGVWQHALLGRNVGDVSYLGVLFVSDVPCT